VAEAIPVGPLRAAPPRGSLAFSRMIVEFNRDPIGSLRRVRRRYGPIVVFRRPSRRRDGVRRFVVTSDPELTREALTSTRFRASGISLPGPKGSAQRRIRDGLFRMHGAAHADMRRLIAPCLSRSALRGHHATIVRTIAQTLEGWTSGEQRDVAREMKHLARRIAARTLFGQADLAESDRIGALLEQWFPLNFRIATRVLPFDLPGLPYRRMVARAEDLERRVRASLERRRREGAEGEDVLSRLARASAGRQDLDDAKLVGQLNMLFLAAHETTAHALTWTLLLLSQHPAIAERVHDELVEQRVGEAPGVDELERLALLERVIRESLRLLTLVPYGSRVAVQAVDIGGVRLARGSRIVVCYDVLHHRPEVFPEPHRFEPDRWAVGDPPPYTYLPFGAGPHVCIGRSFALHTIAVALAMILQRHRPSALPGTRVDRTVTVTLSPRRGVPMRLSPPERRPYRCDPIRGDVLALLST
jgi:cytochrome P450